MSKTPNPDTMGAQDLHRLLYDLGAAPKGTKLNHFGEGTLAYPDKNAANWPDDPPHSVWRPATDEAQAIEMADRMCLFWTLIHDKNSKAEGGAPYWGQAVALGESRSGGVFADSDNPAFALSCAVAKALLEKKQRESP